MTVTFDQFAHALRDRYTLERELGGGGMSRVFLATETRLARKVVVKVLHPELAAGVSVQRFEREIRLTAQLQNPRIVPVLSAGEVEGLPYFTMPFVAGESLRTRIRRGQLELKASLDVLRDIAQALDQAHRNQVVHRDIKPENVLLSGNTAMVTDFGIAKALSVATGGGGGGGAGTLTLNGVALGTPAYMAPEQVVAGDVDLRCDIYAWGVLAYELLTGAHPFASSASPQALVTAHLTESPTPLTQKASGVPVAVADIVNRALAKEPDARPQSMTEVLAALDGAGSGASPRRAMPRMSRRTIYAVAAGLVALVVIAASLGKWTGGNRHVTPTAPGSLAVLNFAVEGSDSTVEYFAEGIADEISTALGRVRGVKVASRSAASHLAARAIPAQKIAEALQVAAVLEGTVRRLGDQLRVTLQLTGRRDGLAIWNGTYTWRTTDVLSLQDTITRAVLAELAPAVGDSSVFSAASGHGTSDPEAYRLYLKARYFFDRRGEAGLRVAIDSFTAAIARDGQYARAYAGRAMARTVLPVFIANANPEAMLAQAEADANQSLAIDSTLADAHLALAQSLKMRWRWSDSERHFRQAIALAPTEALAHHWYGVMLYAVGRPDESVAELAQARSINPFGSTIGTDGALALFAARRYDEARAEIARSLALDSLKSDSHFVLANILLALGRPDSALRAFVVTRRLGSGMQSKGLETIASLRAGRAQDTPALSDEVRYQLRSGKSLDLDLPIAALATGNRSLALQALERLVAARPMLVTEQSLPCEPLLDPLRSEPRFQELLRRAGMNACVRP